PPLPLVQPLSHSPSRFFLLTPPPTTAIYTLSLHDALPISPARWARCPGGGRDFRPAQIPTARCRDPSPSSRPARRPRTAAARPGDRKSTRLNSSHLGISYAVFCLKKKKKTKTTKNNDRTKQ